MTNQVTKFSNGVARFWNDEEAATAVEYGLIVAAIAAVIVAATNTLGGKVLTAITTTSSGMK